MQESKRYDVGAVIPVEFAQRMYKERGIALIVTNGRYVQIEKEPIRRQAK
jgi:hypothetical protein